MAFDGFFVLEDEEGNTKSVHFTVNDVPGASLIFADGQTKYQAPLFDTWITECVFSAKGTKIKKIEIFINGASTGEFMVIELNQHDTAGRQYAINPFFVPAGSMLVFKER